MADHDTENKLRSAATRHGLYVPSGALWGGEDIRKMADRGTLQVWETNICLIELRLPKYMAMLTVCRNRELKRIHVYKLKNVNNENASTFVDGCVWTCVESVDGLKDQVKYLTHLRLLKSVFVSKMTLTRPCNFTMQNTCTVLLKPS